METSMSTTSADRENMYKDYLQKELENAFMMSTPVKKVTVLIERPSPLVDSELKVSLCSTIP